MVDTSVLGTDAVRREGSSPFPGTHVKKQSRMTLLFYMCAREESQLLGFRKDLNGRLVNRTVRRSRSLLFYVLIKRDEVTKSLSNIKNETSFDVHFLVVPGKVTVSKHCYVGLERKTGLRNYFLKIECSIFKK